MIRLGIRSSLSVGLIILSAFSVNAQITQRSEVGAGIGTLNYTGDLAHSYNFAFSQPALTVFYRANVSKVVSFRAGLTFGNLSASDSEAPMDAFAVKRNASFDVFLMEVSGVYEYHFLDWRDDMRRLRFTPYLFAGLGLFSITGSTVKPVQYSNIQMSIPFGGGIKYVLNPKYYIALEFGVRKTFFDYLDNVSEGDPSFKNYQYGNQFDYDSYYYLGFSITRTFYDIPCPRNPYK